MVTGLMAELDDRELKSILGTTKSGSAAGYEGLSPALIKVITMSTWAMEVPTDPDDKVKNDQIQADYFDFHGK